MRLTATSCGEAGGVTVMTWPWRAARTSPGARLWAAVRVSNSGGALAPPKQAASGSTARQARRSLARFILSSPLLLARLVVGQLLAADEAADALAVEPLADVAKRGAGLLEVVDQLARLGQGARREGVE